MNKEISNILSGTSSCVLVNERELKSAKPTSFTAIISGVDEVFCLYPGIVEFIGSVGGKQSVSVLVNNHEMIRYLNLRSTSDYLIRGEQIFAGDTLGVPYRRGILHLEYCTQWKGDSNYPIRMCGRQFFKQNPIELLDKIYIPPEDLTVLETFTPEGEEYEFDEEQLSEWSPPIQYTYNEFTNNKGD